MKNIILIYRGQRFKEEIEPKLNQFRHDKVFLVVDNKMTRNVVKWLLKDYTQDITLVTMWQYIDKGVLDNMKFDIGIINGPYEMQVGETRGNRGKTKQVWDKSTKKTLSLINHSGKLVTWHPPGWRNVTGNYRHIFDLYKSYNIERIDMFDINKGLEVFNAKTPFDVVYITKEPYKNRTELNFIDGTTKTMDITNLEFIPNYMLDEVFEEVAGLDEETVRVLYERSMYGRDKIHMNDEQVGNFKYPCVYSILKDGTVNFMYSNIKKEHFGIPKVICGYGANPTSIIDEKGEFGLTNFAFGIVDEVENLPMIQKALHSEKFQKLNLATKFVATQGHPLISPKILSLLKKDFWKSFV